MRIQSAPTANLPIPAATELQRTAWQVTGSGVRPVLIRRNGGGNCAHVSRLLLDAARQPIGYPAITTLVRRADLFATELLARQESDRRRRETRSADDRRRRVSA